MCYIAKQFYAVSLFNHFVVYAIFCKRFILFLGRTIFQFFPIFLSMLSDLLAPRICVGILFHLHFAGSILASHSDDEGRVVCIDVVAGGRYIRLVNVHGS